MTGLPRMRLSPSLRLHGHVNDERQCLEREKECMSGPIHSNVNYMGEDEQRPERG